MKQVKIGETVYAGSWSDNRQGETEFLCSTQENVESSVKKVIQEMEDMRDEFDGDKDNCKIIVWKMIRIK